MFLSLRSRNFPDRFVRHQNFLGELSPIVSDLDRRDATFFVQELAGGDGPAGPHSSASAVALSCRKLRPVDRAGIEPATPGFSVLCSTN